MADPTGYQETKRLNGKLAWHLVTFMFGVVVTTCGAYLAYPKNLVTKDMLDQSTASIQEKIGEIGVHLQSTDSRVDRNSTSVNRTDREISRIEDHLNMSPAPEQ